MSQVQVRALWVIVLACATFVLPLRRLAMMATFPPPGNHFKQISPSPPNRPRASMVVSPRLTTSERGWEGGHPRGLVLLSGPETRRWAPLGEGRTTPGAAGSTNRSPFPLRC